MIAALIVNAACDHRVQVGTKKPCLARGQGHVIDSVPFFRQGRDLCGPAALASVLAYYKQTVTEAEIACEVFTPGLQGSLISDLENSARKRGFSARVFAGSLGELRKHIDRNEPAIILVEMGLFFYTVPHYLVVFGYDDQQKLFWLHTGNESGVTWPYDRLETCWAKMNHLMLVVSPAANKPGISRGDRDPLGKTVV